MKLILKPKEQEVFRLIAEGYTDLKVAEMLDLSPENVRIIIHRLYRKLSIPNHQAGMSPRVKASRIYYEEYNDTPVSK